MNILIAFASKEGQTEKIAEFIAKALGRQGHQATTMQCRHLPKDFSIESYEAVIIGGPIRMGKYPGYLQKFVAHHLDWLNRVPSALFTVCMAIESKNEKDRVTARSYGQNFSQVTHWQPRLMETFAGAVKYTQYGLITRYIMRSISKKEDRDTDTSQDYEYTDWGKVTQFTEQFLNELDELTKAS
jgi:menaquinone-dependent protoporphyrinogen oxidase